jgi:hypothetical protein
MLKFMMHLMTSWWQKAIYEKEQNMSFISECIFCLFVCDHFYDDKKRKTMCVFVNYVEGICHASIIVKYHSQLATF